MVITLINDCGLLQLVKVICKLEKYNVLDLTLVCCELIVYIKSHHKDIFLPNYQWKGMVDHHGGHVLLELHDHTYFSVLFFTFKRIRSIVLL